MRCEGQTELCRGKAVAAFKERGKHADPKPIRLCLACLALARRVGVKLDQVQARSE